MSATTLPCPVHDNTQTEELPNFLSYLGKPLFIIEIAKGKYYQKKNEDHKSGIVAARSESVANLVCDYTKQLRGQKIAVVEVSRDGARQLARESELDFVFVCVISVEADRFVIEEEIPA